MTIEREVTVTSTRIYPDAPTTLDSRVKVYEESRSDDTDYTKINVYYNDKLVRSFNKHWSQGAFDGCINSLDGTPETSYVNLSALTGLNPLSF